MRLEFTRNHSTLLVLTRERPYHQQEHDESHNIFNNLHELEMTLQHRPCTASCRRPLVPPKTNRFARAAFAVSLRTLIPFLDLDVRRGARRSMFRNGDVENSFLHRGRSSARLFLDPSYRRAVRYDICLSQWTSERGTIEVSE